MTFRRLKRSSINDKLKVTEIVIVSFKTVLIKLLDKLCKIKINFKLQSREDIFRDTKKYGRHPHLYKQFSFSKDNKVDMTGLGQRANTNEFVISKRD